MGERVGRGERNHLMQRNLWVAAVALVFGIALPANAEIIKGSMLVHGCEMS